MTMSDGRQEWATPEEAPASTEALFITSCMAPVTDHFVQALADLIGRRLSMETRFVQEISWQQRERWLDEGRIHVGWLCGLPYVWKADQALVGAAAPPAALQLLAAPVIQGERYGGRPVYFSDVVVRAQSPFERFEQLRGATWAYNERRSHSGYWLTRYNLALRGLNGDFFGHAVGAGSHQRSLQMILAGEVDAAAIDSTVLELVLEGQPDLAERIRVLERWGPSPIPPWLVHRRTPPPLREALRRLFLGLHDDEEGRGVLHLARIARFVEVRDEDYDPIRQMARRAQDVTLGENA